MEIAIFIRYDDADNDIYRKFRLCNSSYNGWILSYQEITIQVGDILAFIQYVRQFNQPISQTAQIANVMQATAAAAERVFEFLEEEEVVEDVKNPI